MHIIWNILNLFFGTVRRVGLTLGGIALLYFYKRPEEFLAILRGILHGIIVPAFHEIITALIGAVSPILPSLLILLVIVYGLKTMFKRTPAKKK